MLFEKEHLSFTAQADLLLSNGLLADRDELARRLKAVNYFRLKSYLHPFLEHPGATQFRPNTHLDEVWKRYTFDRQLRLLIMDPIERVEVQLSTLLAYYHSERYGPFGYTDHQCLPNLSPGEYTKFIESIKRSKWQAREEDFAREFTKIYGEDYTFLPVWMAVETIPFGTLVRFYNSIDETIRHKIAKDFRVNEPVFKSWILSLNVIRNIAAHHGRLYNRVFNVKPKIPRGTKYPEWTVVDVENKRLFSILTIEHYMLSVIAPQSKWPIRLGELLDEYPTIPLSDMGFPENWKSSPIWNLA